VTPDRSPYTKPPSGWGADALSAYFENARINRYASFERKPLYRRLAAIDEAFVRIEESWKNPATILQPMMFVRAHCFFRTACEHALAGQVTETFPQIRCCLEVSGYALHMYVNPHLTEVWLRRHDDDAASRLCRSEFQVSKVRNAIETRGPDLAQIFGNL
jgi:hypothetical protein